MRIGRNFIAIAAIALTATVTSCSSVEPNTEGVLQENYGRNGRKDFSIVTGRVTTWYPGTQLYLVPMYEEKGDPQKFGLDAKDAGHFEVDPIYSYKAINGHGIDIIINYKHLGPDDKAFFDQIEQRILNQLVINAYKEEVGYWTTDSLMNNRVAFEKKVETRVSKDFESKHFTLLNLTSGLIPPESMTKAIEKRNNAIMETEAVRNQIDQSKMLLEKARIDAQTNEVISSGLTDKVLAEKWIDAIRNTDNKVIITDGKTPVFIHQ